MEMEGLKEIIDGRNCLVLGVGNVGRGDDGIGPYVISRLRTRNKLDCGSAPENFTGRIRALSPDVILIVDAVDFGAAPGDHILTEAEKAGGLILSTHSLPLSLFCMMFPGTPVYLIGIQPASFTKMGEKIRATGERLASELNLILK
jgi:hydrogenase 3 maturation protease